MGIELQKPEKRNRDIGKLSKKLEADIDDRARCRLAAGHAGDT